MNLSFSAGGNAPAALEWSMSYPSTTVTSFQATAGPALTASSKTLSCNSGGGVLTCVAAGLNSGAIGSGVVAVLTATVSASAGGTVSIPIGNSLGANPDGTFEAVSGTGGTIAISPTVPSISGLQCSPTTLLSGATSNCTVTLSQAAPAGGSSVALTSSSPALPVPASVTVGAGLSSATFSATASTVSVNQTVIVSALLNGSAQTDITVLPPATNNFAPILINAGGGSYTDSAGNNWSADYEFTGGYTSSTVAAIAGTTDPALYQSSRWGTFSYQIPVPNGSYSVTLKFAETYFTSAGSRLFNVSIDGTPVLANFDIVAQAGGPLRALDKSFSVTVANGQISIQFAVGAADQPIVSAIEVASGSGSPPPAGGTPVFLTNSGGPAYTDSSGNNWSADYDFTGGYTYSTAAAIAGTNDPALYQTGRWGTFSYQVAVPNGSYSVTLKFAETYFTSAGSRLFNVSIDGTPVLTNFDIVAQAGGPLRAVDKSFPVTVTDGQISIQFAAGFADQPTVNAIEVASGSGSPPPAGGTPVFLTNSGGPAYTGSSNTWSADSDFTGGNTAFVTAPILGTADPALYQTCRWGSFSYQIPVPNGSYTVTLKFAEIYFAAAGSRLFNVSINGTPVLTNFDIVAQAGGPLQALDKSFPVIVTNGQIDIQFALGTADQPVVNAIEVLTAN